MDLKEIKTLIDLMKKNDLSEFQLEKEGFKIKLRRGTDFVVTSAPSIAPQPSLPTTTQTPGPSNPATASDDGTDFTSPMVGTYYQAASPESSSFVEIGTEVTEDTTICIIEAMKVMNEIKAERKGVITAILAENGKPVQFGQPLFRIK